MNFGQAISSVFRNYANFNGRARRSEYWYFYLLNFIVCMGLSVFACINLLIWAVFLLMWDFAILVPTIAVTVRRLHDTGRSGVYYLFNFIPVVGFILLIVWACEDSQPGDNIYGRNPKAVGPVRGFVHPNVAAAGSYLGVQCLSGPLQGQTYNIPQTGMLIGTEVDCAMRFPTGTPGVSRHHCEIRWMQGVPVLIDLGSTYGTTMGDGKRLPPRNPERIAAGTRFYVGGAGILLQIITV